MSDDLRAAVAALAEQVEAQQRNIDELTATATRPRSRLRNVVTARRLVLGTAMVFALAATPVLAIHRFSDVPSSNTFHDDIDAIADVGVTTGCAVGKYCPKDFVTREQMAAFLNRLGALQAGKTPVVNATKLDGIDSGGFLQAGNLVVHQLGPWERWQSSNLSVYRSFTDSSALTVPASGNGGMVLNLNLPASVAGKAYGFSNARVCWGAGLVPATLTGSYVTTSTQTGDGEDIVIDETERNLQQAACINLTDPTPSASVGATTLRLHFNWSATGIAMMVRSTTITWVPIAP